jgi:hypothetical protein
MRYMALEDSYHVLPVLPTRFGSLLLKNCLEMSSNNIKISSETLILGKNGALGTSHQNAKRRNLSSRDVNYVHSQIKQGVKKRTSERYNMYNRKIQDWSVQRKENYNDIK